MRLLELISEPEFIKIENSLSEPNIFKIIGRTHYERLHSAFLGWLLDSNGSHLLRDYFLKRTLMTLLNDNCLESSIESNSLFFEHLPSLEFSGIEVTPNENIPIEKSVKNVGRFDIFLSSSYNDNNGFEGRLNIIFELKIEANISNVQSKKYGDWLFENHPEDNNFSGYPVCSGNFGNDSNTNNIKTSSSLSWIKCHYFSLQ